MWLISLRLQARRYPRATAFGILGVFIVFITAPLLIFGPSDVTGGTGTLDFETLVGGIPWQMMLTVILLALIWLIGWWDITQLTRRIQSSAWRPLIATSAYPLIGITTFTLLLFNTETTRSPFEILGLVLLLNFFVGLSEELLFRGILFGALRDKSSLLSAIIVSSLAFGALHVINAGVGQALSQTLFQMVNATALGLIFCALVLQGVSLWPAVLLHMVWNSYAMMGVASFEVMGDVPNAVVEAPAVSPWALLLPALITMIAFAVLRQYGQRTGHRLRDTVPVPGTSRRAL